MGQGSEGPIRRITGQHRKTRSIVTRAAIQGKDLHLHFRYRVWPQEPDVSQVPHIGVPIRACEMDTNYPGSVEHPAIAIQSVAAPCMSRDGDTLHYSIAPNGGIQMFEYVNFDILSETVATAKNR